MKTLKIIGTLFAAALVMASFAFTLDEAFAECRCQRLCDVPGGHSSKYSTNPAVCKKQCEALGGACVPARAEATTPKKKK